MIEEGTGVSVALVITIIIGLVFIGSMFLSIDRRLSAIELRGQDRWTGNMQARFAHNLEVLNKNIGLTVPDCYDIQQALAIKLSSYNTIGFGSEAWADSLKVMDREK